MILNNITLTFYSFQCPLRKKKHNELKLDKSIKIVFVTNTMIYMQHKIFLRVHRNSAKTSVIQNYNNKIISKITKRSLTIIKLKIQNFNKQSLNNNDFLEYFQVPIPKINPKKRCVRFRKFERCYGRNKILYNISGYQSQNPSKSTQRALDTRPLAEVICDVLLHFSSKEFSQP